MKNIKKARNLQNDRNDQVKVGGKGSNIAVIKLNTQLKELFAQINQNLTSMQKVISIQEKSSVKLHILISNLLRNTSRTI